MTEGVVQVMGVNGVSHHVVTDDLEGATAVLHWISMMPPTIGAPPAILPSSDPIERSITYVPAASAPVLLLGTCQISQKYLCMFIALKWRQGCVRPNAGL